MAQAANVKSGSMISSLVCSSRPSPRMKFWLRSGFLHLVKVQAVRTKFEQRVGDYAISAAAVQLTMSGDTCTAARIALTNVSPVPMRATAAEQALVGMVVNDESIESAGQAAAQESDPSADLRVQWTTRGMSRACS